MQLGRSTGDVLVSPHADAKLIASPRYYPRTVAADISRIHF